nr:GIY-YIG nuclease family protein [uncultured Psychroserpens sp.]|tara:strand:- start:139 stop:429 length:291 start_codon:yes stop_codon:yes gene_type:complete
MNYCVYILSSEKINRFYIGYSSNLTVRLLFHENPEKRKFTYNADDWIVYYKIDCISKSQGLAIEAHIKRMKSKIYIQNLLKYPEITLKLLLKYKDC